MPEPVGLSPVIKQDALGYIHALQKGVGIILKQRTYFTEKKQG